MTADRFRLALWSPGAMAHDESRCCPHPERRPSRVSACRSSLELGRGTRYRYVVPAPSTSLLLRQLASPRGPSPDVGKALSGGAGQALRRLLLRVGPRVPQRATIGPTILASC